MEINQLELLATELRGKLQVQPHPS